MNNKKKEHIFHQLKGRTFSEDLMVQIKEEPKEFFDCFVSELKQCSLNDYQVVHIVHILFELCSRLMFGRQNELFEVCLLLSKSNESVFVRSSILMVIVRMMITNKTSPEYYILDKSMVKDACSIIQNIDHYCYDEKSKDYALKCYKRYSFG